MTGRRPRFTLGRLAGRVAGDGKVTRPNDIPKFLRGKTNEFRAAFRYVVESESSLTGGNTADAQDAIARARGRVGDEGLQILAELRHVHGDEQTRYALELAVANEWMQARARTGELQRDGLESAKRFLRRRNLWKRQKAAAERIKARYESSLRSIQKRSQFSAPRPATSVRPSARRTRSARHRRAASSSSTRDGSPQGDGDPDPPAVSSRDSLQVSRVARMLGVSSDSIYGYIRQGRLRTANILGLGQRRPDLVRVVRDSVEALLDEIRSSWPEAAR